MTDTERWEVAKRFMQIREEHHLNQRQMAEMLGVSASLISEIERNSREPSRKILIGFKNVFNRDVEWLLTGIDSSDSTIKKLEAVIKVKDQEISELNREKIALYAQLTAIQAELLRAKDELYKK